MKKLGGFISILLIVSILSFPVSVSAVIFKSGSASGPGSGIAESAAGSTGAGGFSGLGSFGAVAGFVSGLLSGPKPFGGPIIELFPFCVNGLFLRIGPPTSGSFMYVGSSKSYLYGPPRRIGQYLLGLAGPSLTCLVPCSEGLCPYDSGNTIIMHGSSL